MTYNPAIPTPTMLISDSAVPIQVNFQQANTLFAIDHSAFTDNSGATGGKHKQVTLPIPLTLDPGAAGTVSVFYSKTVSALGEAFFQNSGGVTQITSGSNAIWKGGTGTGVVASSVATNGYMTLPNGFRMQWGVKALPGGSGTINFPIAFTSPPFSVLITQQRDHARSCVVNDGASGGFAPTATQFQYVCETSGSSNLYWLAIGN